MLKDVYRIIVKNKYCKIISTICAENEKEAIYTFKKEYKNQIVKYNIVDNDIKIKEFIPMGYK